MTLEAAYNAACRHSGPMSYHCPWLRQLASQAAEVVEFGSGDGVSTTALLAGRPARLTTYDVDHSPAAEALLSVAGDTIYRAVVADSLEISSVECDLLLIDTIHTGRQVYAELCRHANGVRRWIACHDTEDFALWDEWLREPGLWLGIWRWLKDHGEWRVAYVTRESCGMTLLERWKQ